MAFGCVHGAWPAYFSDVCVAVDTVAGCAKLRTSRHGNLIVHLPIQSHLAVTVFTLMHQLSVTVFPLTSDSDKSQKQFSNGSKYGCFVVPTHGRFYWEIFFILAATYRVTVWLIDWRQGSLYIVFRDRFWKGEASLLFVLHWQVLYSIFALWRKFGGFDGWVDWFATLAYCSFFIANAHCWQYSMLRTFSR